MKSFRSSVSCVAAVALIAAFTFHTALAQNKSEEKIDYATLSRIRDEGFRNSKVMDFANELTDSLGPRLTNSPNARRAGAWVRDKLTEIGLKNARLEDWERPFGRGWSYDFVSVRIPEMDNAVLIAYPKAWTIGTNGPVRGKLVKMTVKSEEDLAKYKGKLKDAVILFGEPREVAPVKGVERFTEKELEELSQYEVPKPPTSPTYRETTIKNLGIGKKLRQMLMEEGALAVIEVPTSARGDFGSVFVRGGDGITGSGSSRAGDVPGVPTVVMALEHFGRLYRLADKNPNLTAEIDVRTKFHDEQDKPGFNVLAEIPGTEKAGEIVMLGAHLDSWHTGTGAVDNAAGTAAVMEAVRILQALGLKPRRTIRIGLWTGEEQGLLGSRQYVQQHFASRPDSKDPKEAGIPWNLWSTEDRPLTIKPEQANISAYFNMDNGSGKFRGIYMEENAAVDPIFRAWGEPFRDLGFTTYTMRKTSGTDHIAFDAAGIPGFQFVQDELEYGSRTHHTNFDVEERLVPGDLKQASVILAAFVWQAAQRDEMLPRKALSKDVKPSEEPANRAPDAKQGTGKRTPAGQPITRPKR